MSDYEVTIPAQNFTIKEGETLSLTLSLGLTAHINQVSGGFQFGTAPNLLTNTEAFDNAYWTKTGVTITPNQIVAPDGSTTADAMFETTQSTFHTVRGPFQPSGLTSYTTSVYVKANGRDKFYMRADYSSNGIFAAADFDLTAVTATRTAGTVSNYPESVARITDEGDGWYRCSVSYTSKSATLAANPHFGVTDGTAIAANNGVAAYIGDVTKGAYLWGAMTEAGLDLTAYNPN